MALWDWATIHLLLFYVKKKIRLGKNFRNNISHNYKVFTFEKLNRYTQMTISTCNFPWVSSLNHMCILMMV